MPDTASRHSIVEWSSVECPKRISLGVMGSWSRVGREAIRADDDTARHGPTGHDSYWEGRVTFSRTVRLRVKIQGHRPPLTYSDEPPQWAFSTCAQARELTGFSRSAPFPVTISGRTTSCYVTARLALTIGGHPYSGGLPADVELTVSSGGCLSLTLRCKAC